MDRWSFQKNLQSIIWRAGTYVKISNHLLSKGGAVRGTGVVSTNQSHIDSVHLNLQPMDSTSQCCNILAFIGYQRQNVSVSLQLHHRLQLLNKNVHSRHVISFDVSTSTLISCTRLVWAQGDGGQLEGEGRVTPWTSRQFITGPHGD